jgi:hypothetical protein
MVKWIFKQSALRVYCGLFIFAPLISFAQPRYNVVKDYGFENNDTIWVEYESITGIFANRHVKPGYESQYSGWIDTWQPAGSPGNSNYCYLEQKIIKRAVKDYHSDKNLKYYLLLSPINQAAEYDFWFISIGSQKNRLIFLYDGPNAAQVPKEDGTTHIVKIDIPLAGSWEPETLNFYEKWTEKFSENDTIEKIKLTGYLFVSSGGSTFGQSVNWDNVIFESTRPDSDAAVVDISFSGMPKAKVQNKGAVAVSFPTICDIFKGGSRVYSDTVNVDSLAVDSIKQVSFKSYSDTGNMIIYTSLPGDQNPGNDTLTKSLAVEEKSISFRTKLKVWPCLTKGIVNYESDKSVYIYDPCGRFFIKSEKGRGKLVLKNAGIYFLKSGSAIEKVVVE